MGEGNKEIIQTEFYRGLCLSMFIKGYGILPQCLLGVWYFWDSLPPSDGLSSKKKKDALWIKGIAYIVYKKMSPLTIQTYLYLLWVHDVDR